MAQSSWGLWSFVETVTTTVKQKSDEIISIYKEDLQEFSRTIVADTSQVIKDKVDLLSTNSDDAKANPARSRNLQQARIQRLQRDPKTYNDEPSDKSDYEAWSAKYNVGASESTEAITHLLTSNESVREFHTALVPAKVSYRDFWCRYYYKMHKLEEEEKRRLAILNNANANDDDEEFNWDDDEDGTKANTTPTTKDSPSSPTTPKSTTESTPSVTPAAVQEVAPSSPQETSITPADNTPAPLAAPLSPATPQKAAPLSPSATPQKDDAPLSPATMSPAPLSPATPQKSEIPEPQAETPKAEEKEESASEEGEEEIDDIDEEIARKFETQKLEKTDQKSDAEDGWADWE